jgi:hypothetical protein
MTYTTMFLMYVFGYVTCKTFYYLKAARLGVTLIQTANLFSLFLLTRALENYEISRALCLNDLKQKNLSKENLEIYEANLQAEIDIFKRKSIASLIDSHPDFFESAMGYNDWESGMKFLEDNRDLIINACSHSE